MAARLPTMFMSYPPDFPSKKGGFVSLAGKVWWAIEELNLWLLPCEGSSGKIQGAENKGFPR